MQALANGNQGFWDDFLYLGDQRGEAKLEAHHQFYTGFGDRLLDLQALFDCQRHRFFEKYMLARCSRLDRKGRVRVMMGGDQYGVNAVVVPYGFDVGRVVVAAELVEGAGGRLFEDIDIGREVQLRHVAGSAHVAAPHSTATDQGHIDRVSHLPCLRVQWPKRTPPSGGLKRTILHPRDRPI